MGRKAPGKAPGLPRHVQAHGCLASTRRLSAPRHPSIGGEAKRQSKTRAQKKRRGNEKGCLKRGARVSQTRQSARAANSVFTSALVRRVARRSGARAGGVGVGDVAGSWCTQS